MTDQEIAGLGPAFARYLGRYRDCFLQKRTAGHFDNYCRGLLSDLPRKSVEPIALACGTAARTLQEFLVTADWGHEIAREKLQRRMAEVLDALPDDPLGTVGVIDETSCAKKGDRTPGVRRQYLGCLGKIDNGIVTVHVRASPQVRSRPCWKRTCSCPRCGMRTARDAGRRAFPTRSGIAPSGRSPMTSWSGWTRAGCGSTGSYSTRGTGRRCPSSARCRWWASTSWARFRCSSLGAYGRP